MAEYRFSAKIVSRGGGQSAIAKAAYNSREAIRDERTGEMKDYSRKSGLEFAGIFAPKHAPEWAKDRAQLWNEVERREDRSNRPDDAQLARSIELNLPHELNAEKRKQLVRDFVREQFVRKGMIADVAIHAPDRHSDERNYHAHILLTLREIGPDGFGKKVRDWNSKELNLQWREKWAELGARYLEKDGHKLEADRYRVGHLTLEQQRQAALERGDLAHAESLDREPTKHLGPHVAAQERRGVETEIGNAYRDTVELNKDRAELREINRQIAAERQASRAAERDRAILAGGKQQERRAPANLRGAAAKILTSRKAPARAIGKAAGRTLGKTLDIAASAVESLFAPRLTLKQIREGERATRQREAEAEREDTKRQHDRGDRER